MKQILKRVLPTSILNAVAVMQERCRLSKLSVTAIDVTPLREINASELRAMLESQEALCSWHTALKQLEPVGLGQAIRGGINLGDRQAVYHLVHHLKPTKVLEIGTHVGASTSVIALTLQALSAEGHVDAPSLTTVDIRDVNDPTLKPWAAYGAQYSPSDVLTKLNCQHLVKFVVADADQFFSDSDERFDLVFLDGDHSAIAVYSEIPKALSSLETGGSIVLHDVFPNLQPLWSNGALIPGPWLGVQKLQAQNEALTLLPLGELPWPTKLGSFRTSLALLSKT